MKLFKNEKYYANDKKGNVTIHHTRPCISIKTFYFISEYFDHVIILNHNPMPNHQHYYRPNYTTTLYYPTNLKTTSKKNQKQPFKIVSNHS